MEALILASAVLALARYFGKKSEAPETSSADQPTAPPAIVRDPPPPPPPPPPSWRPEGVADKARLERAHALAVQVAQVIKAQGRAYNREIVGAFQREAGLTIDGVYGPRTAGAVKWYTGESIPPQTGRGFEPYAPFGSAKAAPKTTVATPPIAPAQKQPATTPVAPAQKQAGTPPSVAPQKQPATTTPQANKPATTTPIAPAQKPATTTAPKEPKPTTPTTPPAPQKNEAPRGGASSTTTAPTTTTAPVVLDPARLDRAAGLAKQVAESVKKSGKAYDRALVTAFQREAGLAADGIYGPRTAGAVKWYTEESIPPPGGGTLAQYVPKFDTPVTAPPKVEPPKSEPKPETSSSKAAPTAPEVKQPASEPTAAVRDRVRLDRAAALAKRVAQNLKEPASAYDRALMTEFQREAGLTADGIYGPRSAGAIKWYMGESIKSKTGRGYVQYVPNF